MDFVPNLTTLPNIGEVTDDFKREIDAQQLTKLRGKIVAMDQNNMNAIMQWIQKHDLFHLLEMDK